MLKLGVVGTGWITDKFIDAAKHDKRYTIIAVCSRSIDSAKKFGEKYNLTNCFESVEKMCKSGVINCVYIGTPNAIHFKDVLVCLNNKIHVICEKPLASNANEAEQMISAARENKVAFMEAHRLTTNIVFKKVKEHIDKIGPVHKYIAIFNQYSSKWDRFKAGENFSSLSADMCGGSLMDLGCYCFYPMVILFGKPLKVLADVTMCRTGVDVESSVICKYDDMTALISCAKNCSNDCNAEIDGEKGSIIIEKMNTFNSAKIKYRDGSVEEIARCEYENDMIYEAMEFADIIENGKLESDWNSHFASLETMKILDKARKQVGVKF